MKSGLRYLTHLFSLIFLANSNIESQTTKQIIVTAPAIYNTRLCTLIDNASMQAVPFPVIETSLGGHDLEIDSVLTHIEQYAWIALPSRNAIKAIYERAKALQLIDKLNKANFCAIGKDQEYLKSFGAMSILKNTEPSPQGIAEALKTKEKGKIAVFVPEVIGMPEPNVVPNFIDSLECDSWQVTRINAYTTHICHPNNESIIVEKIKRGKVDLIAFSSTGEIEALLSLVGGKENLSRVPIACFGPYTYENAKKLGLSPIFSASNFSSFDGYVEAIDTYFRKSKNSDSPSIIKSISSM